MKRWGDAVPLVMDRRGAELGDLVSFWDSRRNGRRLPRRRDFIAEEFRPWWGNIAIVRVENDPVRFKAALVGTSIVKSEGRDLTGKYFDEVMPPNVFASFIVSYVECVETKAPIWVRPVPLPTPSSSASHEVARVLLPCGIDGIVDTILVGVTLVPMG